MSQKQIDRSSKKTNYVGLGLSLGLIVGIAMSAALGNWAFIGIGIPLGLSIGVALEQSSKKQNG